MKFVVTVQIIVDSVDAEERSARRSAIAAASNCIECGPNIFDGCVVDRAAAYVSCERIDQPENSL